MTTNNADIVRLAVLLADETGSEQRRRLAEARKGVSDTDLPLVGEVVFLMREMRCRWIESRHKKISMQYKDFSPAWSAPPERLPFQGFSPLAGFSDRLGNRGYPRGIGPFLACKCPMKVHKRDSRREKA
jgi:hypothetical protein